jgi:hypothetical protein
MFITRDICRCHVLLLSIVHDIVFHIEQKINYFIFILLMYNTSETSRLFLIIHSCIVWREGGRTRRKDKGRTVMTVDRTRDGKDGMGDGKREMGRDDNRGTRMGAQDSTGRDGMGRDGI